MTPWNGETNIPKAMSQFVKTHVRFPLMFGDCSSGIAK